MIIEVTIFGKVYVVDVLGTALAWTMTGSIWLIALMVFLF